MIEVKAVSAKYGKKTVVSQVSFQMNAGAYGLLGPNGSGKTTLLRCMAGIKQSAAGEICVPSSIGYLPQRFGMYKELSVLEVMAYFSALKNIPKKQTKDESMRCLEAVNLTERARDKIGSLSGGMLRRVGIAQALIGNPKLLLVDEPTAGLDPEERMRFKGLLVSLQKDRTILISTHIVEDVEAVCSHIILLHKGQVLASCAADELRQRARGRIYLVPAEKRGELSQRYTLLKEEYADGKAFLRVLSSNAQPGELVTPTIEDGYMCCVHEEDEAD